MFEPFVVESEHELRALHRALLEAKFHAQPEDGDVPGSPLVAELSRRIVETLASTLPEEGWSAWREAEQHRHRFPVVVSHIARTSAWPEWSVDQKQEYVRVLLAPFEAQERTVSELVASGDRAHRAA